MSFKEEWKYELLMILILYNKLFLQLQFVKFII